MAFDLTTYLKNAFAEVKRVTWPSRKEALKSTVVVIGFSVVVASFLGVIDYLYSKGLNLIIERLSF